MKTVKGGCCVHAITRVPNGRIYRIYLNIGAVTYLTLGLRCVLVRNTPPQTTLPREETLVLKSNWSEYPERAARDSPTLCRRTIPHAPARLMITLRNISFVPGWSSMRILVHRHLAASAGGCPRVGIPRYRRAQHRACQGAPSRAHPLPLPPTA